VAVAFHHDVVAFAGSAHDRAHPSLGSFGDREGPRR
jgi:hypothetical protein